MSDSTSILFDYTCKYYDLLKEEARLESIRGAKVLVFRGSVVRIFRGMSVSQSYYSKIRKSLVDMGCVSVLRQGTRATDSVLVLHRAPTAEDWENISDDALTPQLDLAIISQRLDDLTKLMGGGIDIGAALANHEVRLEEVEREVQRLGRTPTAKRK
jgi:hypothetical protein